MFDNKKNGFTIAEAMICFILIGIIFVTSIGVLNRKINYDKLYWQAFNILLQASKEYYESNKPSCDCNQKCEENETCALSQCWRNNKNGFQRKCPYQERAYAGGTPHIVRDFPGFLYNYDMMAALTASSEQDTPFCEELIKYINTYPGNRCNSFISQTNNKFPRIIDKGVNFYEAFKASSDSRGASGNTQEESPEDKINLITPSFVSANGQKFYISSPVTANFNFGKADIEEPFRRKSRTTYRFVVVDLNGRSLPNSQFTHGEREPDIVLFAITSLGEVVPIGLPEFSKSYIKAVVYYPGGKMSNSMNLWDAKKYAWGMDEKEILTSAEYVPFGSPITKGDALSITSRLYKTAMYCRKNECNDKNSKTIYADDLLVNFILQFIYSSEGSSEYYSYLTAQSGITANTENGCKPIREYKDVPTCGIDFLY